MSNSQCRHLTTAYSSWKSHLRRLNGGFHLLNSLRSVPRPCLVGCSTYLSIHISHHVGKDDVENSLWLDLLRSFVAVKNLYLSEEYAPRIAPALQELVGERTSEVLPTLGNIFLEGFQPSGHLRVHEGIEKFVAARWRAGHPVIVSRWDGDGKTSWPHGW